MRISTTEMSMQAVAAIDNQQSALAKTQNEVSTGIAVSTASDNPVAASQIVQLNQQQSAITQFTANSNSVQTRLTLEESSLSSVTNDLQSIRDLAVQAGDATLSNAGRAAIVAQIQTTMQDMVSIANTKDSNGEYLFSGYATQTQPFVTSSNGTISYQGDAGNRLIPINSTQSVADSDTGATVFQNIPSGNGTFVTASTSTNTGTGVISAGTVVNASQWVPDNYTVSFTSATAYQVTDNTSNTVVASGTYSSGSNIQFNGIQLSVSGAPASGDSFTVAPSTNQSLFASLNQMVAAISKPVNNSADQAQLSTSISTALSQIDQGMSHLSTVSATVGARLNLITSNNTRLTNTTTALTTQVSDLQSVDYAAAVTTLNQQYVGLQAAEQSFAAISQLSLFKYLS